MLKYIKEHAASIDGVSIYPIFSLLVFVIFFIVLLWYVKKMDAKKIKEISNLPLDLDNNTDEKVSATHLKQA